MVKLSRANQFRLSYVAIIAGASVAILLAESRKPSQPTTPELNLKSVQFSGPLQSFDLRQSTIPVQEIRSGGPPKDGIPALSNPLLIEPNAALYLNDNDRVVGVVIQEESRAYPLKILNHHEIINDRIGETPIVVTYCPLCDSAAVFDRRTPLGEREFGVSGLLYNSNVLMYDRGGQTESLWSQVKAQGVTGPAAGQKLKALPMELTTWSDWRTRNPQTKVVSDQTGHRRNYQTNPYANYFATPRLMFPVTPSKDWLPAKTPVLGVWTQNGQARAYSIAQLGEGGKVIRDSLGEASIVIQVDRKTNSLRVIESAPSLQWMNSFWFAWYAMHPHTDVFNKPFAGDNR